ncbi:MAG: murein biosynthesis integral membrane protein MurJ [Clostridia bacterium]|nr:murein biosynthesis integral membrane protein MurJ [Clostridia bacterium]
MNKADGSVKKMTLTVIIMALATVCAKLLGLVRDVLCASAYGTGTEAIAYETASRLPIMLFDFVIGGVVTAAFIPIFSELLVNKGKERAMRFAADYFNLVFAVTLLISVIGELFAPALVSFLAPDIPEAAALLAVPLTRIMFPMVIFAGTAFCFVGILQCMGHFRLPSIISLFSNGAIVFYLLFLEKRFGVYGLAVSMLVGWGLQMLVQLPTALKLGFRLRPRLAFFTPEVRSAAKAFLPLLVASWLLPVISVINTRFASGIEAGRAVTAVGYANRFYIIIVGVFSFIATNLLFPKLSRASAGGDGKGAKRLTASSMKLLLYVVLPVAAGCFALAYPMIELIFVNGDFTADDARLTAEALKWFCLGMPAMAVNEVLQKLFFSRKQVLAPMLTSTVCCVLDIGLAYVLSSSFGIAGIAASSGIVMTLCAIMNYVIDSKNGRALFCGRDVIDLLTSAVFSVLCGISAHFAYSFAAPRMPAVVSLALSVICGVAVWGALTLIFPQKEIAALLGRGKNEK